jgi:periplasmic divalent cation tolerance protein
MPATTDDVLMVYCTCPDETSGQAIADHLVENRLAACVNLVPGLRSTYWWKGEIQHDAECLLLIKTRKGQLEPLQAAVRAQHPYELPEVVAVPVTGGLKEYLAWVLENT